MSRHRNIRGMNYEDEYDEYDDYGYGHSVEDNYCISPGTVAQFTFNRDEQASLATYITEDDIPEEEEPEDEEHDPLDDSTNYRRPQLSDVDEARLNSCLEEIRNVIGESTPEHVVIDTIINNNFSLERALDSILKLQDAPKPQREPRTRRRKTGDTAKPAQDTITLGPPPQQHRFKDPPPKNTASPVIGTVQPPTPQKTVINEDNKVRGFKIIPQAANSHTPGAQLVPPGGQDDGATSSDNDSRPSTPKRDYKKNLWPSDGSRPSTPQSDDGSGGKSAKKKERINVKAEYEKRKEEKGKELINLVIIGHVDAGKSTLMGHVLYQMGCVNKRTMHKYEQESKKLGKASFAYAWVLDETEEERTRGVTMDVAQTRFETDHRVVNLLDAPGHKDFIPNMITGAAEADVAILVVNATRGEFETGFDAGGQTREHALLIRSLGVSQLAVAVNKMDTVDWAEDRFKEVVKKLGQFLKQAGFKESDIDYIPCSGLSGENLTKLSTLPQLMYWYSGPTLLNCIDKFKPPERSIDKPLRLVVQDVFKGMGTGFSVSGRIEAGSVQQGDKILVMPSGELATVKNLLISEEMVQCAFAGDQVVLTLTNIDVSNVNVGSIVCDPTTPIKSTTRFRARVVIFNIEVPITRGYPVVLHYQSLNEPANIRKLVSQLHKSSGEVVRNKPRCLTKNSNAVIELEVGRPICIELYKDYKDLGRFMLRSAGVTIAAGLVTEILENKASKADS